MVQILHIQDLDDCLGTILSKEIVLSLAIESALIHYIGKIGQLDYYSDFPKPFFKVYCPGKYIIQGIQGNTSIKVILEKERLQENLSDLVTFIQNFSLE